MSYWSHLIVGVRLEHVYEEFVNVEHVTKYDPDTGKPTHRPMKKIHRIFGNLKLPVLDVEKYGELNRVDRTWDFLPEPVEFHLSGDPYFYSIEGLREHGIIGIKVASTGRHDYDPTTKNGASFETIGEAARTLRAELEKLGCNVSNLTEHLMVFTLLKDS